MKPPSRKITILIIIAACAIVGAFLVRNVSWQNVLHSFGVNDQQAQTEADVSQLAKNEINVDSDNDGLKDWEEKLWKTDSHNSDTDHDGTPDGEEVKKGRDPAIAGPNDTLKKETAIKNIIENSVAPDANPTERLSQDFFAQYLSLKQSGQDLSDTQKNTMIGDLVAKQISVPSAYKVYTTANFHILSDGSQDAIRAYGNNLGAIIAANSVTDLENEVSILQSAITNQDASALKDLDPIISRYQAVIDGSLALPVPPTAIDLHVHFVNALSGLVDSITKMKLVIEDPLTSLKGINVYGDSRTALEKSISDFAQYFKANDVTYNAQEYGYTFRTGI